MTRNSVNNIDFILKICFDVIDRTGIILSSFGTDKIEKTKPEAVKLR